MRLRIDKDTGFNEGWKNAVVDQIEFALDYLKTKSKSDPHECIHEIRKAFKKIRASLRLVRFHIDHYKESNVFFRDLGRKVSDIRDATSAIETIDALKGAYDEQLKVHQFKTLKLHFINRRARMTKKQLEQKNVLKEIETALEEKLSEIKKDWSLDITEFKPLKKGIKKVYKRGYKALEESAESGKTEDFHEWRKRAKYMRYQLQLLEYLWPAVFDTLEDELHKITDDIGDDHDLAVLTDIIEEEKIPFEDELSEKLFYKLVEHRRKTLQQRGLHLGEKWYADSPGKFVKRMKKYWEIGP